MDSLYYTLVGPGVQLSPTVLIQVPFIQLIGLQQLSPLIFITSFKKKDKIWLSFILHYIIN